MFNKKYTNSNYITALQRPSYHTIFKRQITNFESFIHPMIRCTPHTIVWYKLSMISDRSVVFLFPPQIYWQSRYNWNLVESGVKHHNHDIIYSCQCYSLLIIFAGFVFWRWCDKMDVVKLLYNLNNLYHTIVCGVHLIIGWIKLSKLVVIGADYMREIQLCPLVFLW
jgi:hypothetical protein